MSVSPNADALIQQNKDFVRRNSLKQIQMPIECPKTQRKQQLVGDLKRRLIDDITKSTLQNQSGVSSQNRTPSMIKISHAISPPAPKVYFSDLK